MGADPSAMLFYGFPIPRLAVDYCELNNSWRADHSPPRPDNNSDYKTPEWDEWRKRNLEWERSLENVEINWGGAEDYEQYFVHCASLEKIVDWDKLLVVSQYDIAPVLGVKELLHEFCDRFNLPKGDPQWHLAAKYF